MGIRPRTPGIRAEVEQADVRAAAAAVATADGEAALLGAGARPDILVNLGIVGAKPALEIDDDEWRHYFEVNVLSG